MTRRFELLPFAFFLIILPFPNTVVVRLFMLTAAFLIAAWHWKRLLPADTRVPGKPAIALWIAISLVSLAYAVDPAYSFREITNEIGYTMMAFFAFYAIAGNTERAGYLLRALALGLTIIGGWAATAWFAHGFYWDETGGYGGIGIFATYLVTVAPVLGWLMLEDESRRIRRISLGLLFFVLFLAVAAGQRAIWPVLAVQIPLFVYLLGRTGRLALGRRRWLATLAVLVAIAAIGLKLQEEQRFGITGGLATTVVDDSRLSFWPEVVANIAQHPLSGGGFGIRAMAKAYPDLIPDYNPLLWHGHNVFLNYGIGMGLPGMLALAALFGFWGWFFWHAATTAPRQAALAGIAGLTLVVGVVLRNQFNDFFTRDMSLMFWALTGLFARLAMAGQPSGSNDQQNTRGSMKILHTEASCGWGGQEIRILEEARGMIGRGHEVTLVCPPEARIFSVAAHYGVPATALPIGRKNLRGVAALRRHLARSRPDVVNTHSSTDTWLTALARLLLASPPPLVRTRHISAPIPHNAASRWLYTRATTHIVTTGERLRETLIRENGYPAEMITSIPTGIDPQRFQPGDRLAARQALGLDADLRYVGIVATLRSWKGHHYLIDACRLIGGHDWRLLIIGDGPRRQFLEEIVARLKLGERVKFLGQRDDPESWLPALDVFCLPSYANEGVPQSMLQAMLAALPIVTTPVGSITEAVEHEKSALIVAPEDSAAIAQAIQRLLDDPELGQRLGAAARATALARYTRETMLDAMQGIFERVTHAR